MSGDRADTVTTSGHVRNSHRHIDFAAVHPTLKALYEEEHNHLRVFELHVNGIELLSDSVDLSPLPVEQVLYLRVIVAFNFADFFQEPKKASVRAYVTLVPPRTKAFPHLERLMERFTNVKDIELVIASAHDDTVDLYKRCDASRVRAEFMYKLGPPLQDFPKLDRYEFKWAVHNRQHDGPPMLVSLQAHAMSRRKDGSWICTRNANIYGKLWVSLLRDAASLGWDIYAPCVSKKDPYKVQEVRFVPQYGDDGEITKPTKIVLHEHVIPKD